MNLGNLNDKQITIIGGIVAGVVAILFIVLSFLECKKMGDYEKLPGVLRMIGKTKDNKAISNKMDALKKKMNEHRETIAKREDLQEQKARLLQDWEELNRLLPKSTNFAELAQKIVQGAKEYNVMIEGGVERQTPVPYDGNIDKVHIKVSKMSATFHDFGNFLYYLYVPLKRFIVLQDFSLKSGAPETVSVKDGQIQEVRHLIDIELVTFVEKDKTANTNTKKRGRK